MMSFGMRWRMRSDALEKLLVSSWLVLLMGFVDAGMWMVELGLLNTTCNMTKTIGCKQGLGRSNDRWLPSSIPRYSLNGLQHRLLYIHLVQQMPACESSGDPPKASTTRSGCERGSRQECRLTTIEQLSRIVQTTDRIVLENQRPIQRALA